MHLIITSKCCNTKRKCIEKIFSLLQFAGNTNHYDPVRNDFDPPIVARSLKIHPVDIYMFCSTRWELYKCLNLGESVWEVPEDMSRFVCGIREMYFCNNYLSQ